jgi:hypothetical protein
MSFAERAANKKPAAGCPIGTIMANLPDKEADALRSMLAADVKTWPHTGVDSIQQAFKDEGYGVSDRTIRNHRAGTCSCARSQQ